MQVHEGLQELRSEQQTVVTIGAFDGVHLAHRKILTQVKEEAERQGLESVVITFWPHPRAVLQPDNKELRLLSTPKEKVSFIESLGIHHLYIIPFTIEFSNWSAQRFVEEILIKRLKTKKLILGYDHHFGKNREGNLAYLQVHQKDFKFEVDAIPEQIIHDSTISSTEIRKALLAGDMQEANSLLGYAYQFTGKVVKGNQLGRTIGFPTANIFINELYKLIPANGVYAVKVVVDGSNHTGMMNIGTRPTVDGTERRIEVNIFDFDADIYDQEITTEVFFRIRDEKKFNSLDELKTQISKDQQEVKRLFSL